MIVIIIPAYNAHDTIIQTLLSIELQTIKDKVNVFIVDDCSDKDYSKEVNFFKNKINIKQIRASKNGGPGASRQIGIDNSNGEYILFLDSDDLLIDCFSLENLYKAIISDSYDLSAGIMVDETSNGYRDYQNHQGCLHGKLYKRKFFEDNKLRFNDTRSSEDNGFNKLVIMAEPKIIEISNYIYLYRNNVNSITQKDYENYVFDSIEWFIYNMVWAVENAIERGYNELLIAKVIYHSYLYVYFNYMANLKHNKLNLILMWSFPLHKLYKKYIHLLSEQEKYDMYVNYEYPMIPDISFREFLNLIELHNK